MSTTKIEVEWSRSMEELKRLGEEYRRLKEVAAKLDSKLQADDPRFRNSVKIIDQVGTIEFIESAFIEDTKEFVLMFSEHNGYRVYMKEDLESWRQYRTILVKRFKE